jgi:hypothetical protein
MKRLVRSTVDSNAAPREQAAPRLAVIVPLLLLGCLASTEARAQDPASEPAAQNDVRDVSATGSVASAQDGVEPAGDEKEADAVDGEADDEPVVGRLRITTDAPATIRVDGEDLGLLEPGDELLHDLRQRLGTIRATSREAPAAFVEETYEIDESSDETALSLPEIEILLKVAKVIRESRKKEREEGVYADFKNGVMWRRQDNRIDVTWKAARRHCDGLEYGGWDDWRLPTIEELDTLQAMWSRAAFKTIDPIRLSDCCPWSSSESDEAKAWNYNFRFRRSFEGQKGFSYGMRALCLRTLTAEELAEREQALEERKEKKKRKKKQGKDDEKGVVGTVDEVSGTAPPDDPPGP